MNWVERILGVSMTAEEATSSILTCFKGLCWSQIPSLVIVPVQDSVCVAQEYV